MEEGRGPLHAHLKRSLLDGIYESTTEELRELQPELEALALSLALRLVCAGKGVSAVANDPHVIRWARAIPTDDAFAGAGFCHLVEEAVKQVQHSERPEGRPVSATAAIALGGGDRGRDHREVKGHADPTTGGPAQ